MSHLQAYLTYGVSLLVAPPLDASVVSVLQAALAGAGGLHVRLVTFLLADSALHHDTTLGLAHAQLSIFRSDGGIGPIVAGRRRRLGAGERLVNGGPERRLREQPARHQREVVRHPRGCFRRRRRPDQREAVVGMRRRRSLARCRNRVSSEFRTSTAKPNTYLNQAATPITISRYDSREKLCYYPRTREHKHGTRQLKRVSF